MVSNWEGNWGEAEEVIAGWEIPEEGLIEKRGGELTREREEK